MTTTPSGQLTYNVNAGIRGVASIESDNYLYNVLRNFDGTVDADDVGTKAGNNASTIFYDSRTLAASSSENLSLATGVAAFTEIMGMIVHSQSTNASAITVGDAASDAWVGPFGAAGTCVLQPGESVVVTNKAGWTVTASTAEVLKVANGAGGSAVYDIVLFGITSSAASPTDSGEGE